MHFQHYLKYVIVMLTQIYYVVPVYISFLTKTHDSKATGLYKSE